MITPETLDQLRPELTPMPARIAKLPVHRGYPVPWFVAWKDGEPEFRAMDPIKWVEALREHRCWVCGETTGANLVFVLGPMCCITRTTSEPPCHLECARWSAHNCPFLTRPQARYRKSGLPEDFTEPAGLPIDRNPGVCALWVTRTFTIFRDENRRPLIRVGDPREIEWYAQGRKATREEIEESVSTGLPLLNEVAEQQDREERSEEARNELTKQVNRFWQLFEMGK